MYTIKNKTMELFCYFNKVRQKPQQKGQDNSKTPQNNG